MKEKRTIQFLVINANLGQDHPSLRNNYNNNYPFFYRFPTIQGLITHLSDEHQVPVNTDTKSFENTHEFLQWKMEEEEKTRSYYVKRSSSQMYGTNKHWYLYCNRTGTTRIKDERQRQVKTQGSCKTGNCCIAHMKVIEDTITGKIQVKYCSTHSTIQLKLHICLFLCM